jgi:hypothetical protein
MPPQPQQPQANRLPGGLLILLDGLAYSLEVLSHYDIGERRCRDMSGRLLLALAVALALTLLTLPSLKQPPLCQRLFPGDPEDPIVGLVSQLGPFPMFGLCLLILVAHGQQRWRAACRRGRSPGHTYYNGRPCLLRRWPRLNEFTCKRWVEPALWAAVGATALFFGMPQPGIYLLAASLALNFSVAQRAFLDREQALDASDGVCDMLSHQQAVSNEYQPSAPERPAAYVQPAAPAPRARPASYPHPQPTPPAAAAPGHLHAGLDPNLRRLLDEPPPEDFAP